MATPAPATSFVDDQFGGLQFGADPDPEEGGAGPILPTEEFADLDDQQVGDLLLNVRKVNREASILQPEVITNQPEPVPEPAADEAEVLELEDGSKVTIDRSKPGRITATLDSGITGAGVEVFHARDDQELSRQLLIAKVNATRRIRQLSQTRPAAPAAPQPPPQPEAPRELSADDQVQIKVGMAADPVKALDKYISAKLGMSLEDVRAQLQEGRRTKEQLLQTTAAQEAKEFKAEHPEYEVTHNNFQQMCSWMLNAFKIAIPAIPAGGGQEALDDAITGALILGGVYTKENLNAAFEALSAQGALDLVEEEPEPEPPAPPVPPVAPPAAPARIVPTTRRLNAPYGIRPRETTQAGSPPLNPKGPSAEEIDAMPDNEVSELLAGIRRMRAASRR